jgi:hypothetical protein
MKVGIAFGGTHALNAAVNAHLPLQLMPMKE